MLEPIKISEFKSGHWVKQVGYKAFVPTKINRQWLIDNPQLEVLVAQAHQKLGELNAFSELVPDVNFFIKMHIVKEATLSSRIEGTQTSVEEAFLNSEDIRPEERNDWQEVQNYIAAINFAVHALEELPLSNRLIRETHKKILHGVRGQNKHPGEFRNSQNWIGGASLADAVFVPPPQHEVLDLMSDLEKFLHNDEVFIPELVRVAIAHYQFETIHPFLDGNGRIGRLLIALFLVSKGLLVRPSLYISAFFQEHRAIYFDNLSGVRNNDNIIQWLKFFMVGVIQTAESSVTTFRKITSLKQELELKIGKLKSKPSNTRRLLHYLFSQPVVTAKDVTVKLNITPPTANNLLKEFMKLGILNEKTGYQRNRVFSFTQYLALFE